MLIPSVINAVSSVEMRDTRTVKALGCICNVCDTQVECEDENERNKVRPWEGIDVCKENLKECKDGVECMV